MNSSTVSNPCLLRPVDAIRHGLETHATECYLPPMPSIDMPLEQMRQYKPTLYREADFDAYWETTVNEAVNQPLNAELIPYVLPTQSLECYAVRFDGYKGGRIAGWYVRPATRGKFPGLCMYHGYSVRAPR